MRAGGLGTELARLGQEGCVPAPQLTENRRQLEAAERQALSHYRAGHIAVSQAIRAQHGWEHDLGSPYATREALADAVAADMNIHGPAGVVALAISHADCEDLADRIRRRLQAAGHIHGPELAGPAWAAGERRYAAGDRLLVHGTLRTGGQRLHNGAVVTVTAVDANGLLTVDAQGHAATLPRRFVEGHRTDGSPNCSHAWGRTVDGIQGATWPQVHLLGTAALERFTGYTGQSRSRHATHTWNVTRLPDIDHGGVLADQRTPEAEVLDALRRLPDTGFAVHDAPRHAQRLPTERTELESALRMRPPDRRPALHQAELAKSSAEKELYWANYRLHAAQAKLTQLGPFSQLRRHGRHEKASLLEAGERFAGDVERAETKIAHSEQSIEDARAEVARRRRWDAQHGWPETRIQTIDAELAELSGQEKHLEGAARDRTCGLAERTPTGQRDLGEWPDRLAEITRPPLPGRDQGHGIDLGL